MLAASAKAPQQLLDEVHTAAGLARFSVDAYARALADERADDSIELDGLAATDAALRAALVAVDGFTARVMRVELDLALADDTVLAPAFRTNLAATIVRYAGELPLLRERVIQSARGGPRAVSLGEQVVAAATAALGLRVALHDAVIAVARVRAAIARPNAAGAARDRQLDDSQRARWSVAAQELAMLEADPARIARGPWAERIKEHVPVVETVVEEEPSFGSLIELD